MRPLSSLSQARILAAIASIALFVLGVLLVLANLTGTTQEDTTHTNIGLTCLILAAIIVHGMVADSRGREAKDRYRQLCQRLTRFDAVLGHLISGLCEVGDRTKRISQLERLQYDLLREMNDGGGNTGPHRLHSI